MRRSDEEKSALGQRINTARTRLDMLQRDIAKSLGVSPWTIGRWEKGETSPSMGQTTRLSELLSVNPEWLLTGDGLIEPSKPVPDIPPISDIDIIFEAHDAICEAIGALRVLKTDSNDVGALISKLERAIRQFRKLYEGLQ